VAKAGAPLKKYSLTVRSDHAGQRLDQLLAIKLPEILGQPLSKAKIRQLVVAGAVYLNGKRVRIASKTVFNGARIDAFIDLKRLMDGMASAKDIAFVMTGEDILYEDDDIIVVNKPAGLPTQPTLDEARANLFATVRKFLSARDSVPAHYLGLHHRLDRDTSGVILFTKRQSANAGVSKLFVDHLAEKTYWALAERPARMPPTVWRVENFLAVDRGGGAGGKRVQRNRYHSVRSGGDSALTDFRLLEDLRQAVWVEAKPRTGRTHQIRVHLSEGGMPILGDTTYGRESTRVPRLMLHAAVLNFPHPTDGRAMSIQAPMPKDFSECLKSLQE
jgi:23S rRNA pseudouridine1911/1915/1917 synthase